MAKTRYWSGRGGIELWEGAFVEIPDNHSTLQLGEGR